MARRIRLTGSFATMPGCRKKTNNSSRDWIDNGVPEGRPVSTAAKPAFPDGWRIPKPDLVVKMPAAVHGAGQRGRRNTSTSPSIRVLLRTSGFAAPKPDRAIGASSTTCCCFIVPPEQSWPRPEDALFNAIAAFAPGCRRRSGPEGYAGRIPAGSRLVFQMHYTPNGSEQVDQSEAGFLRRTPKR